MTFSFLIAVQVELTALSFYDSLKIWGKVVFFTFPFGVFRLPNQILMGSLEQLLFLKLSPEGSRGAPVYYDPRYDSQSNFPAAQPQVERLLF